MAAWEARSEAALAAACQALVGGVGLGGLGSTARSEARRFWFLKRSFGFSTKEAFVLRTEVAFAALAAWETRSEAAWAVACKAVVGGGRLGGLGSTFGGSAVLGRVLRGYVSLVGACNPH